MYSECMSEAIAQPAPPISTDIVIPSREMSKSVQTLPEFLREEAIHIVRTGKSFHYDRKHLQNGLIHLSFFAGVLPLAHIVIPLIAWKIQKNHKDDAFAEDAMKAFNFQLTCTIYMIIFVLLTTAIGLMSFPFIKELSGVAASEKETPLTVMIPTVLMPALSIYICVWAFFTCKVAYERLRGKPAHYPTSISFLSLDK